MPEEGPTLRSVHILTTSQVDCGGLSGEQSNLGWVDFQERKQFIKTCREGKYTHTHTPLHTHTQSYGLSRWRQLLIWSAPIHQTRTCNLSDSLLFKIEIFAGHMGLLEGGGLQTTMAWCLLAPVPFTVCVAEKNVSGSVCHIAAPPRQQMRQTLMVMPLPYSFRLLNLIPHDLFLCSVDVRICVFWLF